MHRSSLILFFSLLSCSRSEEVTHVQIALRPSKELAARSSLQSPPAMPQSAGMVGDVPAPPVPDRGLLWTLPAGWTASSPGGMRYATLKPPVSGAIDVSGVVLPGPAGGELGNVTRWRSQLGLGPIGQAALESQRRIVKSKAGPISVFDFLGDGEKKTRMVVGLALFDDNSWFLKMTGDAAAVAAARKDFTAFLQSLRFPPQARL